METNLELGLALIETGQPEASGRDGAEYVSLRRGLPLSYDGILDLLRADS
jgi:hypothetical protein